MEEYCDFCNNKIYVNYNNNIKECHCGICGDYQISQSLLDKLKKNDREILNDIACFLFLNKEIRKEENITEDRIKYILSTKPTTLSEKIYAILSYADKKTKRYGDLIDIPHAVIFSNDKSSELAKLCEDLEEQNLINFGSSKNILKISLKIKGYEYLNTNKQCCVSDKCFVAMSFASSLDSAYNEGIKQACIEAGYLPVRVDKVNFNGDITDRIVNEINQTKFTIADLSNHRNGVYYEAGYARGKGKEVILCCNQEDFDKGVHFDVNHINIIKWKDSKDLKEKLYERIISTLGKGKYNN